MSFKLTKPTFNHLIVEVCPPEEEKSSGGIIVQAARANIDAVYSDTGVIVDMGPLAFAGEEENIPKIGDKVIFARYAGVFSAHPNVTGHPGYRVIKDVEVVCVREDHEDE